MRRTNLSIKLNIFMISLLYTACSSLNLAKAFQVNYCRYRAHVVQRSFTPEQQDNQITNTEKQLRDLRLSNLRDMCKFQNLPTTGKREQLIQRLLGGNTLSSEPAPLKRGRKPMSIQPRALDVLDSLVSDPIPKQEARVVKAAPMTILEQEEFDKEKFFQEIPEPSTQFTPPLFKCNTTTGWACRLKGRVSKAEWFLMQFDGGSRGNPGLSGAGYVVFKQKKNREFKDMSPEAWKEVYHGQCFLGEEETNNIAEYVALNQGLRAAQLLGIKNLLVEGDSNLVVQQISGAWQVKAEHLQGLYQDSLNLISKFANFEIRHIDRAVNTRADELANRAMNSQVSYARCTQQ